MKVRWIAFNDLARRVMGVVHPVDHQLIEAPLGARPLRRVSVAVPETWPPLGFQSRFKPPRVRSAKDVTADPVAVLNDEYTPRAQDRVRPGVNVPNKLGIPNTGGVAARSGLQAYAVEVIQITRSKGPDRDHSRLSASFRLTYLHSLPRWRLWDLTQVGGPAPGFTGVAFMSMTASEVRKRMGRLLNVFLNCRALIFVMFSFMPQHYLRFSAQDIAAAAEVEPSTPPTSEREHQSPCTDKRSPVEVPILVCHHIRTSIPVGSRVEQRLTVTVEVFDHQMKYLQENGYQVEPIAECSCAMQRMTMPYK